MQSWLSVVMACSTILLQANNTAVPQFIDGVAQVISETPWVILKSMFKIPPDCIIIAVDNNAFLVSFGVMVRSRLPVTMLVTTRSKEEFGTMKKMQPKFDVIALLKEDDDKGNNEQYHLPSVAKEKQYLLAFFSFGMVLLVNNCITRWKVKEEAAQSILHHRTTLRPATWFHWYGQISYKDDGKKSEA